MDFGTFDPADFRDGLAAAANNHQVGTAVLLENVGPTRVRCVTVELMGE